jgi:hypothetical protein
MINRLSKLLFPRLSRDQRKRQMNTLFVILAVAGTTAFYLAHWLVKSGK